jgi:hypothetical protein
MTNSELTRQHRHYRAVRERLVRSAGRGGRSAVMAELEAEVAELASDNATKARRIAALEIDLAPAGAGESAPLGAINGRNGRRSE